jgi:PAS domain S-box-containing protein
VAIRNARTLAEVEKRRRLAEALLQATTALTSTLELEPLLENILAAAIRAIPAAEKGSVLLVDDDTPGLRVGVQVGYQDPRVQEVRFAKGTGYASRALEEDRPLFVPDAQIAAVGYDGEIKELLAVQSAIVAPLRYRGRAIGALSLDNASQKSAFDEEDLHLLSAFAVQAAIALENARLFEAIVRGKREWETTFDVLADGISLQDRELCILRVNRTLAEWFGTTPQELVGRHCFEAIHGSDTPLEWCPCRKALAGEKPEAVEWQDTERARVFQSSAFPLYNEDGTVRGVVHLLRDITAAKKAERDLRASEERYRSLFDGVPIGLYRTTPDGDILDANLALVQMSGHPNRESLLATNVRDAIIDLTTRARWQALMEKEGVVRDFEFQSYRYDGTPLWLRDSARAARNAAGEVLYYEGALEDITGRRTVEQAYRALVDSSPQGLVIIQDERIVFANEAVARMLGCTVEELLLLTPAETEAMLHPKNLTPVWEYHRDRMAGRDALDSYELCARRRDGSAVWVEVHSSMIEYQGKPAVQAVVIDITGRRQAEEAYRALVEGSLQGLLVVHDEGVAFANEALTRMVGYSLDELQSMPFAALGELAHPEDRELLLQHLAGRLRGEDVPARHEFRAIRKDGAILWIETYGSTIEYRGGPATQVILLDVTQRKHAEVSLRRRHEELTALNAIATTIGQSFDLDRILNGTLEKVLELLGLDGGWVQLLDDERSSLSLAAHRGFAHDVSNLLDGATLCEGIIGQVVQSEQPIVLAELSDDPLFGTAAEHPPLYAFAALPILSKDQLSGILAVFRRNPGRLEPQEVQLLTMISHQIGGAVENVRLAREASEVQLLRELNRLRSELIANVSHELRTPLGLIKIFCTTLLRQDATFDRETQQEFLRDIAEEADRLEKIVDNLLDLSQIRDGRLRLEKFPTDLGQLVRRIVETMEAQLTPHHFDCHLPSEPLMANVDAKRIEQVLRNLLSNAVKYSPEGGTITVQGRRKKGQILFQVSDEGIGIPPGELERIFERFYRVENDVTQKVGGAGLGLAVCQGIIQAHGGRIWAESSPGVGSTFFLSLPIGVKGSPAGGPG